MSDWSAGLGLLGTFTRKTSVVVALVVAATLRLMIVIGVVEGPIQQVLAVTVEPVLQAVPLFLKDAATSLLVVAFTLYANTADELAKKLYVGTEVVP